MNFIVVKIYGTKMCPKCRTAEALLYQHGVDTIKVNVDDDSSPITVDNLIEEGFSSFPVLEYRGKLYRGDTIQEVRKFIKEELS